jgi:hypothetical protein
MGNQSHHNADDLNIIGQQVLQRATQQLHDLIMLDMENWLAINKVYNLPLEQEGSDYPVRPSESQVQGYIGSKFYDIPGEFSWHGYPDPESCTPMIDDLWRVAVTLDNSVQQMATDGSGNLTPVTPPSTEPIETLVRRMRDADLRDWTGQASGNFVGDFLDPILQAVTRQGELAGWLALVLTSYQKLRRCEIEDAYKIGQETLDALDHAYLDSTSGTTAVKDSLSIIGALGSLATAAAPAAVLLATNTLAAAVIGAANDSQATPKNTNGNPITGHTVLDVLNNMDGALIQLTEAANQEEQILESVLTNLSKNVNGDRYINIPSPGDATSVADRNLSGLDNPYGWYPTSRPPA